MSGQAARGSIRRDDSVGRPGGRLWILRPGASHQGFPRVRRIYTEWRTMAGWTRPANGGHRSHFANDGLYRELLHQEDIDRERTASSNEASDSHRDEREVRLEAVASAGGKLPIDEETVRP